MKRHRTGHVKMEAEIGMMLYLSAGFGDVMEELGNSRGSDSRDWPQDVISVRREVKT